MKFLRIAIRPGLSALAAALGASFVLGLQSAEAAPNNGTTRSNRGGEPAESTSGSGGGSGKVNVHDISMMSKVVEDMGLTITELETLVVTLQQQIAELSALSSSAQELGQAIDEEQAASAESSAEELARLENAKKAFEEEVAGELEGDVAAEVSSSLDQAAAEAAEGASSEESTIGSDLEELNALVAALQAALEELTASSTAATTRYKDVKVTASQNTQSL